MNGMVVLFFLLVSCQKEISSEPGTDPQNPANEVKLVRIQQGNDPNLANDTIWRINYNTAGRISSIVDSIFGDSLAGIYNAAGRLIQVTYVVYDTRFKYDANGLLTEITHSGFGDTTKNVFTYNNGVIAKNSYYTQSIINGQLELFMETFYTVSGGNIVNAKEVYVSGGTFMDQTFEYSTEPNTFKELALFNFNNRMGLFNFASFETYFNKNLVKKLTLNAQPVEQFENNFIFNSNNLITKIVSVHSPNPWQLTWFLDYK